MVQSQSCGQMVGRSWENFSVEGVENTTCREPLLTMKLFSDKNNQHCVFSMAVRKRKRVEGSRGCLQKWGSLGGLAAPASCSADHATTSDRYSSMRFDPIDTLVYAFDSPGVVLSIRARWRCPVLLVAQKLANLAPLCPGLTKSHFLSF